MIRSLQMVAVGPDIPVAGGTMVSIMGPFQKVIEYVTEHRGEFGRVLALGQNGHTLKHMDHKDQLRLHVIMMKKTAVVQKSARSAVAIIILKKLRKKEFDYAHTIGVVDDHTAVFISGDVWATNMFGAYIVDALMKQLFQWNRATPFETVLFMGRKSHRTIAFMDLLESSYKVTTDPFLNQARHAITGSFLLSAPYKQNKVFALNAERIHRFLTQNEFLPIWEQQKLEHSILEIGVSDGIKDVVVVTFASGDFRFIPFMIHFRDDFKLGALPGDGVASNAEHTFAPIARIATDYVALVDAEQGTVELSVPRALGMQFDRMSAKISSGIFSNSSY